MTVTIRRVGVAIGSLVIAYLCVGLVGGVIPQFLGTITNPVVTIVLGGLVYRDIVRTGRPASEVGTS
jgi:hypothetical protein